MNHHLYGPVFGSGRISGTRGTRGTRFEGLKMFGQVRFRVIDYEVFKIVIE
jgi:hypothetical protein